MSHRNGHQHKRIGNFNYGGEGTCITNHLEELPVWDITLAAIHGTGNSSTTADNSSERKVDVDFGTNKVKGIYRFRHRLAIHDNSTQAYCWGKRADWSDSTGTTQSGTDLLGTQQMHKSVELGLTLVLRVTEYIQSAWVKFTCAVVENTIEAGV